MLLPHFWSREIIISTESRLKITSEVIDDRVDHAALITEKYSFAQNRLL